MDKAKDTAEPIAGGAGKKAEKKVQALEANLKTANAEMQVLKMKSTLAVAVVMISFFYMLSQLFSGMVVAKLPFEPFSIIQNISHRNIEGDDYTECSFHFLYVLVSMSVKSNLQKVLGFAPPRAASPMEAWAQQQKSM